MTTNPPSPDAPKQDPAVAEDATTQPLDEFVGPPMPQHIIALRQLERRGIAFETPVVDRGIDWV